MNRQKTEDPFNPNATLFQKHDLYGEPPENISFNVLLERIRDDDCPVAMTSLSSHGWYAKLPEKCKKELYMTVLESTPQNGIEDYYCDSVLRYIPEKIRDKDICEAALRRNPCDIRYAPPAILNRELCMYALENSCNTIHECLYPTLASIDEIKTVDADMCLWALGRDGRLLEYISDFTDNGELPPSFCAVAVDNNEGALEFVPEHFKDKMGMLLPRSEMDKVWDAMKEDEDCLSPKQ